jgi:hypothetical protein
MLFDREAIEAGNSVLKHWEKVINNPAEQTGHNHCPYCKIYAKIYSGHSHCLGCPISFFTHAYDCINTPYRKYIDAKYSQNTNTIFELSAEMKKLLDEIFIKSLLLFDIREDFYEK